MGFSEPIVISDDDTDDEDLPRTAKKSKSMAQPSSITKKPSAASGPSASSSSKSAVRPTGPLFDYFTKMKANHAPSSKARLSKVKTPVEKITRTPASKDNVQIFIGYYWFAS